MPNEILQSPKEKYLCYQFPVLPKHKKNQLFISSIIFFFHSNRNMTLNLSTQYPVQMLSQGREWASHLPPIKALGEKYSSPDTGSLGWSLPLFVKTSNDVFLCPFFWWSPNWATWAAYWRLTSKQYSFCLWEKWMIIARINCKS